MFKELFLEADENFDSMIKDLDKYFGVKRYKTVYNLNGETLLVSIKDFNSDDFKKFKKSWDSDYHIGFSTSGGLTISAYLKDR